MHYSYDGGDNRDQAMAREESPQPPCRQQVLAKTLPGAWHQQKQEGDDEFGSAEYGASQRGSYLGSHIRLLWSQGGSVD